MVKPGASGLCQEFPNLSLETSEDPTVATVPTYLKKKKKKKKKWRIELSVNNTKLTITS